MAALDHLEWPFFSAAHKTLAADIEAWAAATLADSEEPADVDAYCRALVRKLGDGGWLRYTVAAADRPLDVRSLCLIRETLARFDGLADFSFALQGLGSGPISLFGSDSQKAQWLPKVAAGTAIPAFALSEPEAGSDVAAMTTIATAVAGGFKLNGCKTWISNGGIADVYTVFARTGEAGSKDISCFIVEAATPGFEIEERIATTAPHPLAKLRFRDCFVPTESLLGKRGEGMKVALTTLDVFRSTVGAAALGFARHAAHAALTHAAKRQLFGAPLAALQMIQAKLADMAVSLDASALLIYRAAWQKDVKGGRVTNEAAMAKLFATEQAQITIDDAVQIFGGLGVVKGHPVERLYREIRALRIYEGASEVQKVVISRYMLAQVPGT